MMGEMADYYTDGYYDESPFYYNHRVDVVGPGKCPDCGGSTELRNGKFGKFYGCLKFPKCHGSRSYDPLTEKGSGA